MKARQDIPELTLYDCCGSRKYLTAKERREFRQCAEALPIHEQGFCLMLYFTGLRISEALELTPRRLDHALGVVMIRSLKRRKSASFRAVPLPSAYLKDLLRMAEAVPPDNRLWPFSRKTAYRLVKRVMAEAGISGVHSCPKGLRHGFGIACVEKNIPLPTISKWMGHSTIKTTAIYLNVVGVEERLLAKRIW